MIMRTSEMRMIKIMNDYSYLKEGDEYKIIFANSRFLIVTRNINGRFVDSSIDVGTTKPNENQIIKSLKISREKRKCSQ